MDHSRSELGAQETIPKQAVRIQANLFLVDDEKAGYVWLEAMGDTQNQLVPNRIPPQDRRLTRGFCLGESKRVGEGMENPSVPGTARPQESFDHVQHSYATAALQHKGVSDQLISILNKWWTQSSVEVSLAGIKSDKRIAFQRGLPQGAPESHAIFVAISDYVLGKLDDGWRNRNIGWKLDNIHLTSIAYADDICLLASSKKDLELMVKECIDGFLAAGLETGLDKTFWTSSTQSPNTNLKIGEHAIPWTEKITSVGAKIHLCGNSESAMTNRIQKATGVFEKWSSILCDKSLDLTKRHGCFKASVLSSMAWQSGLWNLTKKTGFASSLLGCTAPCPYAWTQKRTRGRRWLFLDEDAQNGRSMHEQVQHFPREHHPYPETQNGWSLRTP